MKENDAGLLSSLRPYQRHGAHFLVRQDSCLLADEMGLGKTVQAAVALSLLIPKGRYGRALVVVPASLRLNWENELNKWAPRLSVRRLQGGTRERFAMYNLPINVLVASYEQIREDAVQLSDIVTFDVVLLDEAQRIKNPHSGVSLAVRILSRDRSWTMTGTPIENRVDDLLSVFGFVKPMLLNPAMSRVEIHERMRPHFLRRRKEEVLPELPPIIVQDVMIELTPRQSEVYTDIWLDRHNWVARGQKGISSTAVFALITKLKQICNYDAESGESSKLEALRLIIENMSTKDDKLIVFSQYVDTLQWILRDIHDSVETDVFHGALSESARNAALARFREEDGPRVLLVSLRAGGVGLNLQEATSVVLFDRWWNPAVEEQAINRAHRFGRENVLHAFRFVTVNSIEERIVDILDQKKDTFDKYIEEAETASTSDLNLADMIKLLDLQGP